MKGKSPITGEIKELGFLFKAGNFIAMESRARQLLARYPSSGIVWNALGVALQSQGKNAIAALQNACRLLPRDFGVASNLANSLLKEGQIDEALASFGRAIKIKPDFAEGHYNLGVALQSLRRFDEAVASYSMALKLKPDLIRAQNNLGNVLRVLGRPDEALACFKQVLNNNPSFAEGYSNLGNVQKDLGLLDEAELSFRRAVSINPEFAEGHYNLGATLQDLKRNDEALACYQRALTIKPDYTEAHNNLGNTLKDKGQLDEAEASYIKALRSDPYYSMSHSNLLFTLNYHPDKSAEEIFQAYRLFDERFALPYKKVWQLHSNSREINRRLKVGYVSPDFKKHSVRLFLEPLLSQHDKNAVEIYAYAELNKEDEVTARYRGYVDHWILTKGMSDETLADRIRADAIDILVDLAGHTAQNRLLVFARKPAPVSLSWLGFGYTTGLSAVDYFMTDEKNCPPGCEELFSEIPYRLETPAIAFRPPEGTGDVGPLPATKRGHVTFGTLTRSVRVNHRTIRVWAEILKRVEGSRLIINSHDFKSSAMQDDLADKFAAHGIGRNQLEIGFNSPPWDVLRSMDIGLDCFPHNSGTTLFESLYMGVPFVTLAGRPSVGRLGSSVLVGARHPEWIAQTEDEYVEIAAALAADLPKLASLRSGLRQEMQDSSLMDEAGFAKKVETAYRKMWVNWCGNGRNGVIGEELSKQATHLQTGPIVNITSSRKLMPQTESNELVALFNAGSYLELESKTRLLLEKYPESGFAWKALGAALQSQGKEALSALQKATELLPDDADAYNNLGNALRELERLNEAEASFRRALALKPDFAEAYFNLGVLAVQVGKPAAALPLLKSALENKPKQGQYWLIYAETLLKVGHTEAARSVLAQGRQRGLRGEAFNALAGRLDNLENTTQVQSFEQERAIALREAGRYSEAALLLQSGSASNSQDASAYALLAQVLLLNKQDEEAWEALNTALSINPVLSIVQRNHARLLLKQQKLDEALQLAQTAYQSDDTEPENHLVFAAVLGAKNQKEQALKLVASALQIRPNYAEAFATRALFKLSANDYPGALADAEKALSIKPHLVQLWGMVGSLRYQLKNISGAIEATEKALYFEPDNVGHLLSLGEFKRQAGEVEVAISLLEKATEIAPENVGAWVNLGTALQQSQQIPEAKAAYSKALEIEPEQAEVANNLGSLAKEEGNWEEGLHYFNQALKSQPNHVAIITNRAVALNALSRFDEAEQAARQAIALEPLHTDAYLALSGALTGQKKYEDALLVLDGATPPGSKAINVSYPLALSYSNLFQSQKLWTEAETWARRALELKPYALRPLRQLGLILDEQNRYEDAWVVLQEALKSAPEDADTLQVIAGHYARQDDWNEAETWARQALMVKPKSVKILRQLGLILDEQKRYEDAWVVLQEALERAPENADTLKAITGHYARQEDWNEAETWARRVLVMEPNCVETLNALACFVMAKDEPMTALHCITRSLKIEESSDARSLFVQCVTRLQFRHVSEQIRDVMLRALCEPWGRPIDLVPAVTDTLKLDPHVGECVARAASAWPQRLDLQLLCGEAGIATVAANDLLCSLLVAAPVNDIDLERFLTMVRRVLLDAADKATTSVELDETILNFYCALARQCFINEYVFALSDCEMQKAGALHLLLVEALEAKTPIAPLLPVAVAAYFPLCSLPNAGQLLERLWPKPVTDLLLQQVREPAEELQERISIPRLTDIEDDVSVMVQNQYEENPYPRWVKTEPAGKAVRLDQAIHRLFPMSPLQPLGKCSAPDILIAGCGTGQHPIGTAQLFPKARVLAIDLSLASLSYAKRKTRELDLTSIEYAQADLLKLGLLGRSFDLVESIGVLHHLADPLAGWRVLLSLLRPGGVMKLGFYSELARRHIVRIRALIAERGYGSSAGEIRRCRQDLMALDENGDFGRALKTGDFFSISGCRDMLFHVQEKRMTLTSIEAFIRTNGLTFLGFEIKDEYLRAYKRRFPDDRAARNLGQWHVFENENPDTFFGMYQFWIQKGAQ